MDSGRGARPVMAEPADATSDEGNLVRQAQAGDAEAFGRLVTRYMRPAYFAALGLVGSREDALDLSQEAFARAFRARRTLDPERPFYPWCYAILRRLCFNFLRDRRRRARKLEEGAGWLEAQSAAQFEDPARAAERREDQRRVADALAALPDHDREVLVLKEFEGLKYREIAVLVGVPMGTVMSRLYAARQRLAAVLEGER
ncbi:MAG TPA: sigma-70 family RNA polymerase sigma factor [Vicinamibacterales bacterium]|nr:sigma-70 family RNA polymerase sigma factor [Vicinamibacterales bacterium]